MLSRARIEGRARPPRGVNPYIRAPAPTCTYDGRTSRPIPTSPPVSVRTDRGTTVPARDSDGRARRTRRPANPCTCRARSMTLILCGGLRKSGTVIDIEVVSQHANAADVTTAQRGVPLQALQARAPTTIRPAAVDPLTAPRVATFGQIPAVVVRSATALRARPQTDVHFAWSFAARNPTRKAWSPRTGHAAMGGALPAGAAALPRLGRSGNQERFCSSNALASRRSLRMTAVRATFGGFP